MGLNMTRYFPDFPEEELPDDGNGFWSHSMHDCSSSIYDCPSFCLEDKTTIWVALERKSPSDRTNPDAPRFKLFYECDHEQKTVCLYSGDQYLILLARIFHIDEMTEQHGDITPERAADLYPDAYITEM